MQTMKTRAPLAVRLGLAWCVIAASLPALASQPLPLGLYRIDLESRLDMSEGQIRFDGRVSGATGDQTRRARFQDKDSGERHSKGEAPVTHCVSAIGVGKWPELPAMGALACPAQSTKTVGDKVVHTMLCPDGRSSTMTIRQLDKTHWEYISEHNLPSAGIAPAILALRPALEHEAKFGATPQARAKAEQQLKELPALAASTANKRSGEAAQLEAVMNKSKDPAERAQIAKVLAHMQGTVPMKARTRHVWTRIADTCLGGQH